MKERFGIYTGGDTEKSRCISVFIILPSFAQIHGSGCRAFYLLVSQLHRLCWVPLGSCSEQIPLAWGLTVTVPCSGQLSLQLPTAAAWACLWLGISISSHNRTSAWPPSLSRPLLSDPCVRPGRNTQCSPARNAHSLPSASLLRASLIPSKGSGTVKCLVFLE